MAGHRRKWDVLSVGLAVYDHLTVVKSFDNINKGCGAEAVSVQGGGMAATASAAIAKLGGKVRFYTRAGDDFFGKFIVNTLKAGGGDVKPYIAKAGLSPVCDVMVDASGERRFIYFSGKGLENEDFRVPEKEIVASGAFLTDGHWADPCIDAAEKAVKLGVPIVTDVGRRGPVAQALLKLADYPVLSTVCLGKDGGCPAEREKLAREVLSEGRAKLAVVTCGGDGAELYERDGKDVKMKRYPAYKVKVVDTCGAGDAFHGAFALGISRGWPIDKVMQVAMATGALTCRALGGRAPLPTMTEVEDLIASGRA